MAQSKLEQILHGKDPGAQQQSFFGQAPGNINLGNRRAEQNIQQLQIDPITLGNLQQTIGQLMQGTQGLGGIAGNLFTQFGQFTPSLNAQFGGFTPSQALDATSQNLVSQGQQGLMSQANAAARAAQRNVGGGAGNILGNLAQQQARIQQNPLMFQAAQDQRAREAQQFQLNQQAQQLANQAAMQQAQQQAQFQQLQNQAMLSQGLLPLQAQSNLLADLGRFAQLTGRQAGFQEVSRLLPGGGFQTVDINSGG